MDPTPQILRLLARVSVRYKYLITSIRIYEQFHGIHCLFVACKTLREQGLLKIEAVRRLFYWIIFLVLWKRRVISARYFYSVLATPVLVTNCFFRSLFLGPVRILNLRSRNPVTDYKNKKRHLFGRTLLVCIPWEYHC